MVIMDSGLCITVDFNNVSAESHRDENIKYKRTSRMLFTKVPP